MRLATGAIEARNVRFTYHATGEVTSITRDRSQYAKPNECGTPIDAVVRSIGYDSLGRMKENTDPNTGTWRYVYNVAGDLIGTSDARGCGVNYNYDAAGRLTEEDYWPCEDHHEPYDASPEVIYSYDFSDGDTPYEKADFPKGRLVSVVDRAAKTVTGYDQLGRVVQGTRFIYSPQGAPTEQLFTKTTQYDAADRPILETTGARDHTAVATSYTRRGAVDTVVSGDATLVSSVKRDADGLVTEIKYGGGADPVRATTSFDYDDLRRLRNLTTYRGDVAGAPAATGQLLLQDEQYIYDRVGNPVEIRDWRSASEWNQPGSRPVSRKMVYDDLLWGGVSRQISAWTAVLLHPTADGSCLARRSAHAGRSGSRPAGEVPNVFPCSRTITAEALRMASHGTTKRVCSPPASRGGRQPSIGGSLVQGFLRHSAGA